MAQPLPMRIALTPTPFRPLAEHAILFRTLHEGTRQNLHQTIVASVATVRSLNRNAPHSRSSTFTTRCAALRPFSPFRQFTVLLLRPATRTRLLRNARTLDTANGGGLQNLACADGLVHHRRALRPFSPWLENAVFRFRNASIFDVLDRLDLRTFARLATFIGDLFDPAVPEAETHATPTVIPIIPIRKLAVSGHAFNAWLLWWTIAELLIFTSTYMFGKDWAVQNQGTMNIIPCSDSSADNRGSNGPKKQRPLPAHSIARGHRAKGADSLDARVAQLPGI
mmetsp:Transcript_93195/g.268272  ORF Transcript_93195/g.268272 Transcript_93195/m.268272 type:complete len:281 (+) Transcript_93195:4172-5014(+)